MCILGFPQIRDTIIGVPIIRILLFCCLYRVRLFWEIPIYIYIYITAIGIKYTGIAALVRIPLSANHPQTDDTNKIPMAYQQVSGLTQIRIPETCVGSSS